MRAKNYSKSRGFTLVELMIVVAIIGVLAALAIYGVRRYLASSKTSEAKNTIGAISRGATAAFERETTSSEAPAEGASSTATNHTLCASATAVPDTIAKVKGTKYQPKTGNGTDFESGNTRTGWKCLKFGLTQPHYYQYRYTKDGGAKGGDSMAPEEAPTAGGGGGGTMGSMGAGDGESTKNNSSAKCEKDCYEASARGDLDGDGATSLFARTGQINTTTFQLRASTQIYIFEEYE